MIFSVFVREASVGKLPYKDLSIIHGDVLNEDEVNASLSGNFTDVIVSIGSQSFKNSGIRANGTLNIVNAIKASQNNSKIHIVSAFGVGDSLNDMGWFSKLFANVVLKNVMLDHEAQEEVVKQSGFAYHIVRPVGLQNGPATGKIISKPEGKLPSTTIKRADVAQYLVDSLINGKEGFSNICGGK